VRVPWAHISDRYPYNNFLMMHLFDIVAVKVTNLNYITTQTTKKAHIYNIINRKGKI
jgi:hypothetical protein